MNEPVLILTYYWPPAGGSGVQRWMYFARYLSDNGISPYVVTVDEHKASYQVIDNSLTEKVNHIPVERTSTRELLRFYSKVTTGSTNEGIPLAFAGEKKPGLIKKAARFVRGNFFIPDARKGWNRFALKAARELIRKHQIKTVITTGPPHSTHLVGLRLKEELGIKWVADFRDPWRELYYNQLLYRTKRAERKDEALELKVLTGADGILTVGPGMKKLLAGKIREPEKIHVVYNGFDDELFNSIVAAPLSRTEMVITHIGLLTETQPIDGLLLALKDIFGRYPHLREKVVFKAAGKVSEVIVASIEHHLPGLKTQFPGYVSHADAIRLMKESHLLLNSIPQAGQTDFIISGKTMEYIASGRPVLGLGNPQGDAALLINAFPHCRVIDRGNIKGIIDFMEKLLLALERGESCSHEGDIEQYARKNTARQLAGLLLTAK